MSLNIYEKNISFNILGTRISRRKKCPYSELFWSVFSPIRTECEKIRSISLLIQSKYSKIWTRINSQCRNFYAVYVRYIGRQKFPKLHFFRAVKNSNLFNFFVVTFLDSLIMCCLILLITSVWYYFGVIYCKFWTNVNFILIFSLLTLNELISSGNILMTEQFNAYSWGQNLIQKLGQYLEITQAQHQRRLSRRRCFSDNEKINRSCI